MFRKFTEVVETWEVKRNHKIKLLNETYEAVKVLHLHACDANAFINVVPVESCRRPRLSVPTSTIL